MMMMMMIIIMMTMMILMPFIDTKGLLARLATWGGGPINYDDDDDSDNDDDNDDDNNDDDDDDDDDVFSKKVFCRIIIVEALSEGPEVFKSFCLGYQKSRTACTKGHPGLFNISYHHVFKYLKVFRLSVPQNTIIRDVSENGNIDIVW